MLAEHWKYSTGEGPCLRSTGNIAQEKVHVCGHWKYRTGEGLCLRSLEIYNRRRSMLAGHWKYTTGGGPCLQVTGNIQQEEVHAGRALEI